MNPAFHHGQRAGYVADGERRLPSTKKPTKQCSESSSRAIEENLWVDHWALLPAVFKSQDWGRGPKANWTVSRDIITWRRNEETRCLQIGSQSVKEKNTMTWQGCISRKIDSGGWYLWFLNIRTVTLNAGIW
jgi:hypothetical protein